MLDWLDVWDVGSATGAVFRPILEDLAKDVAKDAAKSYVGQCFKKVFSVIHRDPLTKATGLALKQLLELIESELIRADIDDAELYDWSDDVRRFIENDDVQQAISSLFLQPEYHLDPKTFATAWQQQKRDHTLPNDFSWQYITKRFATKVVEIRQSSSDLQETFASLAKMKDSPAIQELTGLPPDFNLDTYREALVERYGNLDFANFDTTGSYYSNVRLWSIFVPQSVREVRECHDYNLKLLEVPKGYLDRLVASDELDAEQLVESEKLHDRLLREYVNQPQRPVLGVAEDSAINRLVILGDPGSGKSSLLRYLALRWARVNDANLRYTQPLSLLIDLREYNRWGCTSGKSFPKYLHEASTWHRLNQQTLKHLLEQPGRVVLLLDGLDEVFDPAEREQVVNDIHRFSNDYKNARIVVTSRVVGYRPLRLRNANFRHFMLQDLTDDQIGKFLNRWHDITFDNPGDGKVKRESLAKAIEKSKSIAQLAGNPLLLTMMAILNRHQKLPDDRVDLYQQCSRLLLHQWDVERALGEFPGLGNELGLREKTDILRSVAYAMQTRLSDKDRANYINGPTLTSLIEDYLRSELHFTQARAVARVLVDQLRQRNFILCYLGEDSYGFVHRTFLEYFCAAEIVHQFNVARTLYEQDLIVLFDNHCCDDDWREVLLLICGQIDEQFVGRIIEHLATRVGLENWDGRTSLPELTLAIGCLKEVRHTTRIENAGALTLNQVIECARKARLLGGQQFLMGELLPVCKELGMRWPGRELLVKFEGAILDNVIPYGLGEYFWPHLIAFVLGSRPAVMWLAETDQGLDGGSFYRRSALHTLIEKWPDDSTRELLAHRAVHDDNGHLRSTALKALAEKWPDEITRELLTQRAVQDDNGPPRCTALRALAEKWPDENTRELLVRRAVQDDIVGPRGAALHVLAGMWPDKTTRELLIQRAVQDDNGHPRGSALWALAETWPDETTRELLTQRAVQDGSDFTRSAALRALAATWPDESTRELLTQRAVHDGSVDARGSALQVLIDTWPDETTREVFSQRAVQDDNGGPRRVALRALAEKWPDDSTRELLAQRAVQDDNKLTRCIALEMLAEKWPDKTTRELLVRRAIQDYDGGPRSTALRALAEKWPDDTTRELLSQRAVQELDKKVRCEACSGLGRLHSDFGLILSSRNLDGRSPYLDPLEPIPRGHIERASKKAGIRPDDIEVQITSLSAHFGWDILCGAGKS